MFKHISMMNGWIEAPHCWKVYLTKPFRKEVTPAWTSYSILGFVFFIY
jgi:hypothetical protein